MSFGKRILWFYNPFEAPINFDQKNKGGRTKFKRSEIFFWTLFNAQS